MTRTVSLPETKYAAAFARRVADGLVDLLAPYCEPERLCIAGSLRRGKLEVGDVEILYISKTGLVRKPGEMFESTGALGDIFINELLWNKLQKRPNVNGGFTWGLQNKLAVHKASGLPVDLFATTPENWWVSLVIRTGPKELNIRLIQSAKARGLQLHAYGAFTEIGTGAAVIPASEMEVFSMAGVPYLEPEQR